MKFGFTPEAEILNARAAMVGFVAAVGSYLTTGQISLEYSDVSISINVDRSIHLLLYSLL